MAHSVFLCVSMIILYYFTLSIVAEPQFEIREGNCTKAKLSDLAFQKNVHLSRLPFVRREAKVSLNKYKNFLIYT